MPLRPPWALIEHDFQDACTRCGDCIAACPEHILIREGAHGYPMVDFAQGECTFCQQCVNHCPTPALNLAHTPPWTASLKIANSCITAQNVICTTCAEHCEAQAIRFTPTLGRVSQPSWTADHCTYCGACVVVCPTSAIAIQPIEV